ncbi:2-dehydropantoate 2-reductase [Rheinheimera sp.]|uniref:ketopantoate reductase family protein n=1 Tax=Rheinheimera sp. TaxID=1869214 RepID=UPI00307E63BC
MNPVWTVVGQGAIGLLAASRLHLNQQQVQLFRRQPGPFRYQFEQQQQGLRQIELPAATAPIRLVLIPVKAYAVLPAVRQLLPLLSADAQVVLCHNGMGTIEQVLPLLSPAQSLWFVSTSQAAFKPSASQIRHTGSGPSYLACLKATDALHTQWVQSAMALAFEPLTLVDDITPLLWRKLAVNSVINPLTAVHQIRNGELAQPQYQALITQLLSEFIAVAQHYGQAFDQADISRLVYSVIGNTAGNYSSMQQDKIHGRPLELDAITGYLLQRADEAGLTLPAHQALYQALRAGDQSLSSPR